MLKNLKNICVIGGGYWGKNHIKTLYELGCLGGIVDSDKKTVKSHKDKYKKILFFDSFDKALESNQFDGYVVATPAITHYKIASKILKNKKAVLVEKPLALNVEECEDLVGLAKKNKSRLMVGHLLLFHPAIIKMKKLINEGLLGEIAYLYSNRLNFGQVRSEENVLWSLGPHDISIFQYLIGSYPKKIFNSSKSILSKKIDDISLTNLEYENGVSGHIFHSWLNPFKEHKIVIVGSKAMLVFEDSHHDKPLTLYNKNFKYEKNAIVKNDGEIRSINYTKKMPLTEQLKSFIMANPNDRINKADGTYALDVIKILVDASKD